MGIEMEKKNATDEVISKPDTADERISEQEDRSEKSIRNAKQRNKDVENMKETRNHSEDKIRSSNKFPLLEQQGNKAYAAQWLPEFLVHNIKEFEVLLMCKKSYLSHSVSSKNPKAIVKRAAQLAITVTKPNASLCSEENE
uniref:60S ribosomal protein L32-like n=1 Tax=Odobenus rosmarus divergens TaxID=9708 RepID=UPI00063CEA96|nr:PREDICTED: 60S ribosomal protein L32-like [Odobenus rosmarus divergens]